MPRKGKGVARRREQRGHRITLRPGFDVVTTTSAHSDSDADSDDASHSPPHFEHSSVAVDSVKTTVNPPITVLVVDDSTATSSAELNADAGLQAMDVLLRDTELTQVMEDTVVAAAANVECDGHYDCDTDPNYTLWTDALPPEIERIRANPRTNTWTRVFGGLLNSDPSEGPYAPYGTKLNCFLVGVWRLGEHYGGWTDGLWDDLMDALIFSSTDEVHIDKDKCWKHKKMKGDILMRGPQFPTSTKYEYERRYVPGALKKGKKKPVPSVLFDERTGVEVRHIKRVDSADRIPVDDEKVTGAGFVDESITGDCVDLADDPQFADGLELTRTEMRNFYTFTPASYVWLLAATPGGLDLLDYGQECDTPSFKRLVHTEWVRNHKLYRGGHFLNVRNDLQFKRLFCFENTVSGKRYICTRVTHSYRRTLRQALGRDRSARLIATTFGQTGTGQLHSVFFAELSPVDFGLGEGTFYELAAKQQCVTYGQQCADERGVVSRAYFERWQQIDIPLSDIRSFEAADGSQQLLSESSAPEWLQPFSRDFRIPSIARGLPTVLLNHSSDEFTVGGFKETTASIEMKYLWCANTLKGNVPLVIHSALHRDIPTHVSASALWTELEEAMDDDGIIVPVIRTNEDGEKIFGHTRVYVELNSIAVDQGAQVHYQLRPGSHVSNSGIAAFHWSGHPNEGTNVPEDFVSLDGRYFDDWETTRSQFSASAAVHSGPDAETWKKVCTPMYWSSQPGASHYVRNLTGDWFDFPFNIGTNPDIPHMYGGATGIFDHAVTDVRRLFAQPALVDYVTTAYTEELFVLNEWGRAPKTLFQKSTSKRDMLLYFRSIFFYVWALCHIAPQMPEVIIFKNLLLLVTGCMALRTGDELENLQRIAIKVMHQIRRYFKKDAAVKDDFNRPKTRQQLYLYFSHVWLLGVTQLWEMMRAECKHQTARNSVANHNNWWQLDLPCVTERQGCDMRHAYLMLHGGWDSMMRSHIGESAERIIGTVSKFGARNALRFAPNPVRSRHWDSYKRLSSGILDTAFFQTLAHSGFLALNNMVLDVSSIGVLETESHHFWSVRQAQRLTIRDSAYSCCVSIRSRKAFFICKGQAGNFFLARIKCAVILYPASMNTVDDKGPEWTVARVKSHQLATFCLADIWHLSDTDRGDDTKYEIHPNGNRYKDTFFFHRLDFACGIHWFPADKIQEHCCLIHHCRLPRAPLGRATSDSRELKEIMEEDEECGIVERVLEGERIRAWHCVTSGRRHDLFHVLDSRNSFVPRLWTSFEAADVYATPALFFNRPRKLRHLF